MKKAYQHPVAEIEVLHMQTLMTVPSVGGGSGIDNEPGKGEGESPSGPGIKDRDDFQDAWKDGLW